MRSEFQITAQNTISVSAEVVPTCEMDYDWNAYECRNPDLGILNFASQDGDYNTRIVSPIYVMDDERGFNNKINSYEIQCFTGTSCGHRIQKFIAFIDVTRNYTIEYTGTPPKKQDFRLQSDSLSPGTLLTIRYPDAGAYKIYKNDELVIPTDWDIDIENWAVPTGKYCGENRFLGVKNTLQFWLEPGC